MMQAFSMRMRGRALGGGAAPLDAYTENLICAYSTRQLLSSYSNALLRVSRTSDSAEQDIGQVDGGLDEAALTTFVGANSANIEDLYDQFGANDVARVGDACVLVDSGVINEASAGVPAIYIQTLTNSPATGFGNMPAIANGGQRTYFARFRLEPTGYALPFVDGDNVSRYGGVLQDNGSTTMFSNCSGSAFVDGVEVSTRNIAYDTAVGSDVVYAAKLTTSVAFPEPRICGYRGTTVVSNKIYLVDFVLFDGLLSDEDIAEISGVLGA